MISEYLKTIQDKLRGFQEELESGIKDVLVAESENLTDVVRTRIQEKGRIATKKLSNYSTKGGKYSWKRKREKAGLQTAYKDLTFSGAMLDSLGVKKIEEKANVITVFSDVSGKNKKKTHEYIVEKLGEQEGLVKGTIIDAQKGELDVANKRIQRYIKGLIRKYEL